MMFINISKEKKTIFWLNDFFPAKLFLQFFRDLHEFFYFFFFNFHKMSFAIFYTIFTKLFPNTKSDSRILFWILNYHSLFAGGQFQFYVICFTTVLDLRSYAIANETGMLTLIFFQVWPSVWWILLSIAMCKQDQWCDVCLDFYGWWTPIIPQQVHLHTTWLICQKCWVTLHSFYRLQFWRQLYLPIFGL